MRETLQDVCDERGVARAHVEQPLRPGGAQPLQCERVFLIAEEIDHGLARLQIPLQIKPQHIQCDAFRRDRVFLFARRHSAAENSGAYAMQIAKPQDAKPRPVKWRTCRSGAKCIAPEDYVAG